MWSHCGHSLPAAVFIGQHNSFTGHSFYIKVPNQPVKTSALVWRKCRANPAFQSHFTLSRACSVSTEIRTLTLCCCVASTQKTVGHNNQEIILVSSKHVLFAFYVFVNVWNWILCISFDPCFCFLHLNVKCFLTFAFIADDSHYSTVEDAGYSVIQY